PAAGPRQGAPRPTRRAAAAHGRTVQEPDQQLPGGAVAPEEVDKAVAIEVALSDDRPGARRRTRRPAADHAGAIRQPSHHLPTGRVVPDDVAQAVAVEVMGARGGRDKHPSRPGCTVVAIPAHDCGVAGQRDGEALPGWSNGARAEQLVPLLGPPAAAAGEHPRGADTTAVEKPAHDGGVATARQRDGGALRGGPTRAGSDQLAALLRPPPAAAG